MIRIIKGKRYNTETATRVADISGPIFDPSNFRWDDTHLYVTRSGAWFVAGQGGPMSQWSRQSGDGWTDGSGLYAVEPHKALELLEKHGNTKAIEQYFADQITEA